MTFAKPRQKAIFTCCVELDATAADTKGNALAARNWAEFHQLSSLSLVTANYHMPRALLYFQRMMPDIAITLPVTPPDLSDQMVCRLANGKIADARICQIYPCAVI